VPVLPSGEIKVYQVYSGYPPAGKYPATNVNWLDKKFRSSPGNGLIYYASTDTAPIHYGIDDLSLGMFSALQIYRDYSVPLFAGSYIVAHDYFNHNLPYTLWSQKEGWYIPTSDPNHFGGVLLYLSQHPPFDVNYDKPPQPYYRWYMITEQDVQEWRIQELEDKVNYLQQQQQY
jgi:hypothetical protein